MDIKYKITAVVVTLAATFAAGRYSVDQPEVKTVESVKTDDKKLDNIKTNTVVTQVEVKKPDGTDTITTVTKQATDDKSVDTEQTDTHIEQTVASQKKGTLNASALVGVNINQLSQPMVYGGSLTKEVLGPVTAGAWFLTNGTIGVSLGLSF